MNITSYSIIMFASAISFASQNYEYAIAVHIYIFLYFMVSICVRLRVMDNISSDKQKHNMKFNS